MHNSNILYWFDILVAAERVDRMRTAGYVSSLAQQMREPCLNRSESRERATALPPVETG